jgi:hypothetical protein
MSLRKNLFAAVAKLWFSISALLICSAVPVFAANVPSSSHVVVIMEENHGFSAVLSQMPNLVFQGNANGYATNYLSDSSGSLMNYLWIASGSCHAVNGTCAPSNLPSNTHSFGCNGSTCTTVGGITDSNIFQLLDNAGISWKVYAESYPGSPTSPDNAPYYRRHNGATWYAQILNNVNGDQSKIVSFSPNFANDVANNTLPRYVIIVPNGNDDAHDGSLGAADTWLQNNIFVPLLSKSYFQAGGDGQLYITFDECGGGTNGGCDASVYTAVIGPKVVPHTVSSTPYRHENLLRSTLEALGITTFPGAAATAIDMSDFFGIPPTPVVGGIDDMTFTCTGGQCFGTFSHDTATQLDGQSLRADLVPGGTAFAALLGDTTPSIDLSAKTNYALDFWANISVPANSEAVEFSMIQNVGGFQFAFQHQCEFKVQQWRVWNPASGGSWVNSGRGCSVFGSGWVHFVLAFWRDNSNHLYYTGLTVNGVFFPFNLGLTYSATAATGNTATFRVRAVGLGGTNPPGYTMWVDKWQLF